MGNVQEYYGCMVFNDKTMRERLPKETYAAMQCTIALGKKLPAEVASVVANTMKDWAIEKGVTHYTHWFQPMTGVTAEKHDSFLSPVAGGGVIMEFSGKELVRGEPDASSFPSGGLRATFEARGYTAWDPMSYAFIKDNTLCIPTAFCSYGGQALDKRTPLLRSMDALNRQAIRVLRLFGNDAVTRVSSAVGAEQEYFLVDRKLYEQRKDLLYCGRTLFGARPPKGQELDDHFFGSIKPRVAAFMRELDEELWKLGIPVKTEHNEAAPAQHEMAAVYSTATIATDNNQLAMDMMKKVAARHGLACLLHEKPFAGVNGSGKHNNWSLCTDTGVNLFEPGETPAENAQFLLFLAAVIKTVDDHQDLLRISVASAGNDHRFGTSEAPPTIMSVYLGDELTSVLDALIHHNAYKKEAMPDMSIGVHAMIRIPKDTTDRNRTSPFAFTGNKFEFRSVGSSMSIAEANTILNTGMADTLQAFADKLEGAQDFRAACAELIIDTVVAHKRILFNGNNYSQDWAVEAKKRGLLDLRSTPDALPYFISEKNVALFSRQRVLSEVEIRSRYEIMLESYCKVMSIEALTMLDMVHRQIVPAVVAWQAQIAGSALSVRQVLPDAPLLADAKLLAQVSALFASISDKADALHTALVALDPGSDALTQARQYRDSVFPHMQELRCVCDEAELLMPETLWPMPTYGDLMTRV